MHTKGNTESKWISVREATEILAPCSRQLIHRLCDRIDPLTKKPYLIKRPLAPKKFHILEASVLAFKAAIEADPDFGRARGLAAHRRKRKGDEERTRGAS